MRIGAVLEKERFCSVEVRFCPRHLVFSLFLYVVRTGQNLFQRDKFPLWPLSPQRNFHPFSLSASPKTGFERSILDVKKTRLVYTQGISKWEKTCRVTGAEWKHNKLILTTF